MRGCITVLQGQRIRSRTYVAPPARPGRAGPGIGKAPAIRSTSNCAVRLGGRPFMRPNSCVVTMVEQTPIK